MLHLFIGILGIIITILLVIGIHEFGHFLLAKIVNVKVLRFSIGFGKPFYRWHDKSGTEYALAPIPLGGYVKLLDENESEVDKCDLPFAFNRQPIYKRFAIVIAGPLFNFIFALLIYWVLFVIGFVSVIPIIGKVTPHSIAAQAGMQPQQEIIAINHVPTQKWDSVIINLLAYVGDKNKLTITTKNSDYVLDLTTWHLDDLKPDPLESLGIIPYEPTISAIIGKIAKNSPAALKLKTGDKILILNNKPIKDWDTLAKEIESHPNTVLLFKIERQKKIIQIPIEISSQQDLFFNKHGYLGISPQFQWPDNLLRLNKYAPGVAFSYAYHEFKDILYLNVLVIEKIFTGKISFSSIGGPITIFASAGTALNHGIIPFLNFLAFLCVAIGFINILPIPGLDGGHILFQAIELVARRPVSLRWQILFYRLGFILLLLLIMQALINDIQRL